MKRTVLIILALSYLLVLFGCSKTEDPNLIEAPNVTTGDFTITPPAG